MRRRDILKLAVVSTVIAKLLNTTSQNQAAEIPMGKKLALSDPLPSSEASIDAQVTVDWTNSHARTTLFTFGSNDYEILTPERAQDPIYQKRLAKLGIGLIRIHQGGLSDTWSNPVTQTWDEAKIKAGYDVSYPQKHTIIQNIPGWPQWMARDQNGLLDPSEYDRYAAFCAELVAILNQRQQRGVIYWEPLNEQDVAYQNAGKLDELWTIYNKAATAMKAKDPQINVGGPVLTWDEPSRLASFLEACKQNVDFVSWHRYGSLDAHESTDNLMSGTPNYYGAGVQQFQSIVKQYIPDRKVPLLLGEYNINSSWDSGEQRQNTNIGAVWFASVLKHLADAGIDMATHWHLKDGIYGLIDPQNHLRPAATVFAWAIKYLTGSVMNADSSHPFVEAMAVTQANGRRSLLLINKSAGSAKLSIQAVNSDFAPESIPTFYLDANGIKKNTLTAAVLNQAPLVMTPYSLTLLHSSIR